MAILGLMIEKAFWQDVFSELASRDVFITHVVAKFHPDVSSMTYFRNHKVKALDTMKFFKLKSMFELTRNNTTVLDKKILDYFESVERDYYILTDRFNYLPRSFRYKKRLFRESIRFWLSYLQQEKIEMVVVSCTPHDLPSFMAYHAAKYLNIPTLSYGHTMIDDYITCEADYRNPRKVPANYLENLTAEQVLNKIPQKLSSRSLSANKYLEYSKFLNQQALSGENKMRTDDTAYVTKKVTQEQVGYMGLSNFRREINLLFMDEKVSKYTRKFLKKRDVRRISKLKSSYSELAVMPDFSEKFIYYSMHLQPERTATPEAGIFEDQLMAIEILSKSVPPGWKVYVKEHPAQFHIKFNLFKSAPMRDESDYTDILRHKNVRLICLNVSSKDLVEHSQLVSTLSGSVGWETLQAGRACLIFSNAWYMACRSVMKVVNVQECKSAIDELVTHDKETVNLNFLKYLSFMENHLIVGNLGDDGFIAAMTLPYKEHVDSVAANIEANYKVALTSAGI